MIFLPSKLISIGMINYHVSFWDQKHSDWTVKLIEVVASATATGNDLALVISKCPARHAVCSRFAHQQMALGVKAQGLWTLKLWQTAETNQHFTTRLPWPPAAHPVVPHLANKDGHLEGALGPLSFICHRISIFSNIFKYFQIFSTDFMCFSDGSSGLLLSLLYG